MCGELGWGEKGFDVTRRDSIPSAAMSSEFEGKVTELNPSLLQANLAAMTIVANDAIALAKELAARNQVLTDKLIRANDLTTNITNRVANVDRLVPYDTDAVVLLSSIRELLIGYMNACKKEESQARAGC